MKKTLLLLASIICLNVRAQITLDNNYAGITYLALVKLQVSGYKYVVFDYPNMKIYLHNTNHTLFKSITIPPVFGQVDYVCYISETLFDGDNLVEYVVQSSSANNPNNWNVSVVNIFKENGTLLMSRDSSAIIYQENENIFYNSNGVFFDGANAKMKLRHYSPVSPNYSAEIYTLPGTMPCSECSSGNITGISAPSGGSGQGGSAVFYPNPVTDQLKLKYELPQGYKNAEINIYDIQGKLIENFRVTNTFDFIYLPTDYNNGLYLYALVVDGKTIKTEKVILDK